MINKNNNKKSVGNVSMTLEAYNEMYNELLAFRNAVKVRPHSWNKDRLELQINMSVYQDIVDKELEKYPDFKVDDYVMENVERHLAERITEELEENE